MDRKYNFNPGPAALPLEVLEEAQQQFVNFRGIGMSLMEVSHRSRHVEALAEETERLLLETLGLPRGYRALFMGGGASAQFALVPMNFLHRGRGGSYVLSGSFAVKAYQEAKHVGSVSVAATSEPEEWRRLPAAQEMRWHGDAAYVHLTTNNTIEGSQFKEFPDTGNVPLIADMTSDILSRRLDLSRFAMLYAGAQKNLGPAGITAVVIREELLAEGSEHIPVIFRYKTYADHRSLYNTPPVHSLYMVYLVLQWVRAQGGIDALERRNEAKAQLVYDAIDAEPGFYRPIVQTPYRSTMNITWRMDDAEAERRFVQEAEGQGFDGLAGHRSVGGLRASAYNAVPYEACKALSEFMTEYRRRHG